MHPAATTGMSGIYPSPEATLRERTQHKLRDAILDGHFQAGQNLVERELCDLSGASRSVVREALVNLEVNGLIVREYYRGYRVATLNARMVAEAYELRALLETSVVELFAERASEREMCLLQNAQVMLERGLSAPEFDPRRARIAKQHYYDVLFTGCRNEEIRSSLASMIDRVLYLRNTSMQDPGRRPVSLAELQRLTEALLERDRLTARAACLAHLRASRDSVLKNMAAEQANEAGDEFARHATKAGHYRQRGERLCQT